MSERALHVRPHRADFLLSLLHGTLQQIISKFKYSVLLDLFSSRLPTLHIIFFFFLLYQIGRILNDWYLCFNFLVLVKLSIFACICCVSSCINNLC